MLLIDSSLQCQDGLKKATDSEFEIMSITSGTKDNVITAGTGKGINFENPYIKEEQLKEIYNRIMGIKYLPCSVKWFGNPASEAGDVVSVTDSKENKFKAYICSQSLDLTGGFITEIKSTGKSDAEIQFASTSPTEKKIEQVYTNLQKALSEATSLINTAKGGCFRPLDTDGDGVNDMTIWADRKDAVLPPNAKCIVANYEGFGWSTDGGRTYHIAITHDKGIIADAITTGVLKSADGQTYINLETGDAQLSGNLIQSQGNTGFSIQPYDTGQQQGYSISATFPNEMTLSYLEFSSNSVTLSSDSVLNLNGLYQTNISGQYLDVYAQTNILGNGFTVNCESEFKEKTFMRNYLVCDKRVVVNDKISCNSMNINGDLWASGNGHFSGSVSQGSLEKLKKNFERFDNALDIVKKGDVYKYHLKTQKDTEKKHYGFVIGDKYDTPEEVISQERDGIDLYSMNSILWKAVQELTQRVEKLEVEKDS